MTNPARKYKSAGVAEGDAVTRARSGIFTEPMAHWVLLFAAAALAGWVRLLPLWLGAMDSQAAMLVYQKQAMKIAVQLPQTMPAAQQGAEITRRLSDWREQHRGEFETQRKQAAAALRAELSYEGEDGARHVFLGDLDSYHWLRMARNYLRSGTTCDTVVDGQCRDTYANAPVGRRNIYNRSLHVAAIVGLHRLITRLRKGYPLPASSFLVPVIVGVLGVFPAFALGRRFAGDLGGLSAALVAGLNPLFLTRSIGSDDDVWNVVLPLFMVWAATEAVCGSRPHRQALWALLAAGFAGLHAATWNGWTFTYAVVLLALIANLMLEALSCAIDKSRGKAWDAATLRRAVLVSAVFYLGTALFATIAGAGDYFSFPLDLLKQQLPLQQAPAATSQVAFWPDVFSTVAELAPPNLGVIARYMGAPVLFFVSWLGLLVLLLPKAGWKIHHFAVLIGGNYLYWYLLTASHLGRTGLLALLALPIAAAVLIDAIAQEHAPADRGAALMIVVWFLGALFLSYQGNRYIMLLVAPFAIAFGVAVGRLHQWVDQQLRAFRPQAAWFSRSLLFVVLSAVLIPPVQQGYIAGQRYIPKMNDAWWNALTDLREASPADAIVNAWWDYGYWIKYVAQRRVIADGGALRTHTIYWTARALAAPTERESVGLLRMLDCGSDATPEPEGSQGADGKLIAYGLDELRAESAVAELATRNRAQAKVYLAGLKLDAFAQADVVRSTHCDPSPAYLLLTSEMDPLGGWWYLANWDFGRAYVLNRARVLPQTQAVADLVSRFNYSQDEASSLYELANRLGSRSDEMRFLAPDAIYFNSPWIPCRSDGAGTLTCDANLPIDPHTEIRRVEYHSANPTDTRVVVSPPEDDSGKAEREIAPGTIILAGTGKVEDITVPSEYNRIGILVDAAKARIRIASPELLRSTFSRLMYLDGKDLRLFEKAYEATGFAGERVTVWKINWQRLDTASN